MFDKALKGYLHLDLEGSSDGVTRIAKQSFRAPMHLSKPHWDGKTLLIQAVNCTAGLFCGDEVEFCVSAKRGASVAITSPSAQRAYPPRGEGEAVFLQQKIEVREGAWLEVNPEFFIPHKGAKVRQQTALSVGDGGELFFVEAIAPGRVGAGESLDFSHLDWLTELRVEGRLLLRERFQLHPESASLALLRQFSETAYHASAILVSPCLKGNRDWCRKIALVDSLECRVAATFLSETVVLVRCLATGSMAMREVLQKIRAMSYAVVARSLPEFRKL